MITATILNGFAQFTLKRFISNSTQKELTAREKAIEKSKVLKRSESVFARSTGYLSYFPIVMSTDLAEVGHDMVQLIENRIAEQIVYIFDGNVIEIDKKDLREWLSGTIGGDKIDIDTYIDPSRLMEQVRAQLPSGAEIVALSNIDFISEDKAERKQTKANKENYKRSYRSYQRPK